MNILVTDSQFVYSHTASATHLLVGQCYNTCTCRRAIILGIVLFAFIAIQLSWMLRPFVGHPAQETRFLREDAMGNAYIEIGHMVIRLVTG